MDSETSNITSLSITPRLANMRTRSKSMYAEFGPFTLKRNDDEGTCNSLNHDIFDTDDTELSKHRQLELLNMIQKIIPRNDILPFNGRIEKIKWDEIKFECYTGDDLKTLFLEVLKTTRKHRLLIELIEEKHKATMSQLGVRQPTSAYGLFVKDHKDEIQSMLTKNPKRGSYGRIAGEIFKKADEKVKKNYQKKAIELKEEFQKTNAIYELVKPRIVPKERKRKEKISPVNTYIEENIADDPDVSRHELRSEYKNLPKKKKLELILKCIGIQNGSKANLEQYERCRACLTKEELNIFDEYENRPHLCTAYNLYVKDTIQKQNDPETPYRERFKKAAQQWNSLPSDVKQKYIEKAGNDRKLFTANLSRFIASLPEDRQEYEIKMISSNTTKTPRGTKKGIAEQATDIKDSVEARNVNNGQENGDIDDDKFEDEDSDEPELIFTCNTSVVQPSTRSGRTGVDDDDEHDMIEQERSTRFGGTGVDDDDEYDMVGWERTTRSGGVGVDDEHDMVGRERITRSGGAGVDDEYDMVRRERTTRSGGAGVDDDERDIVRRERTTRSGGAGVDNDDEHDMVGRERTTRSRGAGVDDDDEHDMIGCERTTRSGGSGVDDDEHEMIEQERSTRSGGARVDENDEHDMFKRETSLSIMYTDYDDSDGSIHLFNSNKANKLESPSKSRSEKKLDKDNSPFKSPMRPAKKFHGESSQTDEDKTPKKTKSRKRKASETTESDSSGVQSYKKVKDKLNQDEDHSQSNCAEKFKQIMALKAPEAILEYLANKSYDGSLKKAKKGFKSLSESEKEAMTKEHEKAKRKFFKKLEKFKATINKSEFDRLLEDFSQ